MDIKIASKILDAILYFVNSKNKTVNYFYLYVYLL